MSQDSRDSRAVVPSPSTSCSTCSTCAAQLQGVCAVGARELGACSLQITGDRGMASAALSCCCGTPGAVCHWCEAGFMLLLWT